MVQKREEEGSLGVPYEIVVKDLGTEGYGELLRVQVIGFSLIQKRFPTEEERVAGETEVLAVLHRGWASNYEAFGALEVISSLVHEALTAGGTSGVALPDEEEEEVGREESDD